MSKEVALGDLLLSTQRALEALAAARGELLVKREEVLAGIEELNLTLKQVDEALAQVSPSGASQVTQEPPVREETPAPQEEAEDEVVEEVKIAAPKAPPAKAPTKQGPRSQAPKAPSKPAQEDDLFADEEETFEEVATPPVDDIDEIPF